MTKGKTKDGLEYLWTDKKRTLFGLPLSFTRYYLTESRLITRIGLLTVVEDELDIYRITDKGIQMYHDEHERLVQCLADAATWEEESK